MPTPEPEILPPGSVVNYIPDTGRHNDRDQYQLPDGRKAPELLIWMQCPRCEDRFRVDVYLGVALHENCPSQVGSAAPMLQPMVISVWVEQRPAKAVFLEFDPERHVERRGQGGAVQ